MRSAYISIVIAVQEASEAASSSVGRGPASLAAVVRGLVDDQAVPRISTSCLEALAPAGDGVHASRLTPFRPSNSCGFVLVGEAGHREDAGRRRG